MKHSAILTTVLALALTSAAQQRFAGGDISLLPTYEEHNANYYTHDGQPISSLLDFCRDEGMNAMRVRLFVDPANAPASAVGEGVRQDLDYVVKLATRIKACGLRLMLDFHYSDTWADPAKQWTPKAWLGLDDAALADRLYTYTRDVLQTLNAAGATPDFIQTGNEISYGMLWGPTGCKTNRCYAGDEANWPRFTDLLKAAGRACREQCPGAKIVIHVERIAKPDVLRFFYDKMQAANIDYDIIGLSYYPEYHGYLPALDTALTTLETRYPDKEIMLCELGYSYHYALKGDYDYSKTYPLNDAGQLALTRDVIATMLRHPKATGIFWWFMEANEYGLDWQTNRVLDAWWNASLFDNETGRATSALSALREFVAGGSGIAAPSADTPAAPTALYTLGGQRLAPSAMCSAQAADSRARCPFKTTRRRNAVVLIK